MTSWSCTRCLGYGTICASCRRVRYADRKMDGTDAHRSCARRPKGVIECPEHETTMLRCDGCGVRATYYVDSVGTRPGHTRQPGWQTILSRDLCPSCAVSQAIANDAVGGLDMKAVGKRAFENLLNGLKRIDLSLLTSAEVSQLRLAIEIAAGQLAAARAKARHERRHPGVTHNHRREIDDFGNLLPEARR